MKEDKQNLQENAQAYLDVPCPPIQVHMQILDLAVFAKELLQILLAGLFMDIGDENDPAFDRADGDCAC